MNLKAFGWSPLHLGIAVLLLGLMSPVHGIAELSKEFQDYMLQHHYGVVALAQSEGGVNEQKVEAQINGKTVFLNLDTCYSTTLTDKCARRLGLSVIDTGTTTVGIGGKLAENDGIALVKSFKLGNCEINRTSTIEVLPRTAYTSLKVDGYLGLDYLKLNSAIIPVGGSGFLIKPGPTPIASVKSFLTLLGYKSVSLVASPKKMFLECHVNGHPLRVAINTASSYTTFDPASLTDVLGQKLTPVPLVTVGVDGHVPKVYVFKPAQFDIGGFTVQPITMTATQSPLFKKGETEGFLGADVMRIHRGIIDLGEHLLWLK